MYCKRNCIIVSLSAAALTSCWATPPDVRDAEYNLAKEIKESHDSISDQHVAQNVGDVQAIKSRMASAEAQLKAAVDKAEREYREAEETRRQLTSLASVVLVVGDVATGGRISPIIETINKRVDDLGSRTASIDAGLGTTRDEVAKIGFTAAATAAAVDSNRAEIKDARTALESLGSEVRTKIAASSESLAELRANAGNAEQFQRELDRYLSATGLTRAERAEFRSSSEGLSTEEIIALLAAAGAGIGGGAAASRLGKSRSKEDIDALYAENEELRRRTSQNEVRLAGIAPTNIHS